MDYFRGLLTVGAVKSEYRRLAKLNHPDLGGVTSVMQAINAAYHTVLAGLNGQTSTGTDGREHAYYYKRDVEQEVMDKVVELLGLGLVGVDIEIIGTWIWVGGDTRPVKDSLKAVGLRWHSKRSRWYWRRFTGRRRYNKRVSFEDMRYMYGSRTFESGADDSASGVVVG